VERLVDPDLPTAHLTEDADLGLPDRARTVVLGGGIVGCSVAHHLAELGDTDVVVLERDTLGSGTTWHAAGLTASLRGTAALTELAVHGIRTYRALGERTGVDVSFDPCGSISLARTEARMDELRHAAALARQCGTDAELVTPAQVAALWPLADVTGVVGGLHLPSDGHLNPGHAAVALATLARAGGARLFEGVEVVDVRHEAGQVTGVRTSRGDLACERVVIAAGLWSRDLAARCGANVPLYPAEHVHVRSGPVQGAVAGLPVLRDLDGHLYVRHEAGRLLVGAFEPAGIPRRVDEVPTGGFAQFPADWDHFAPVRAMAEERVPVLRTVGYDRFLNAPESFTPDTNFCLGETAEVRNLFVAAGFNSQGIIYAPGAGRALAEWMTAGCATFDAAAVDVQRFAQVQGNRRYLHERTEEALGRLYAMHWPHLQPRTARGVRRSPLHERLARAGACFGETAGWERANWYARPGQTPEYTYTYDRPDFFDSVAEEHRAAREAVALFDLSSFTKVEVVGPEALAVLQQLCTAQMDVAVGRVRYTLVLNEGGGIELDGTVVRLEPDRFLVLTPAWTQTRTLGMLRRLARGRAAAVFDATAGLATIAVMGPASRALMRRVSPQDFSDEAQPYLSSRRVEVGRAEALCLRVSFVGELGYELYPSADVAVEVYDALVAAGGDVGLRHAGYHALESLRSEKGYRHLGHDIGPGDDPWQAGLGFTVSSRKAEDFVGRAAVEAARDRPRDHRTVFVALRDPAGLLLGDETILCDGRPVGRLTSGSYGFTLGRACGIGRLDTGTGADGRFHVDCAGELQAADVSDQPFYDPSGERLRG
jgi:glycine cleavage system aminomethyltransferase T/glycine/D-amino acid oxidase-like deaminating enzyme